MPSPEIMQTVAIQYSEQPTYTAVEVDGNEIVVTVRQADGLILDQFKLVDRSNPDTNGGNQSGGVTDGDEPNGEDSDHTSDTDGGNGTTDVDMSDEKSGCGSSVGAAMLPTLLLLGGAAVGLKKKRVSLSVCGDAAKIKKFE
jgi:hypothetical protein